MKLSWRTAWKAQKQPYSLVVIRKVSGRMNWSHDFLTSNVYALSIYTIKSVEKASLVTGKTGLQEHMSQLGFRSLCSRTLFRWQK